MLGIHIFNYRKHARTNYATQSWHSTTHDMDQTAGVADSTLHVVSDCGAALKH